MVNRFSRLMQATSESLTIAAPREANVAIFPADWSTTRLSPKARQLAQRFAAVAREAKIACVFLYFADFTDAFLFPTR